MTLPKKNFFFGFIHFKYLLLILNIYNKSKMVKVKTWPTNTEIKKRLLKKKTSSYWKRQSAKLQSFKLRRGSQKTKTKRKPDKAAKRKPAKATPSRKVPRKRKTVSPKTWQEYIENAETFFLNDFPPYTVMADFDKPSISPILTSISKPVKITDLGRVECDVSRTRWFRKGANLPPKILKMEYVPPGPLGIRHLARQYTMKHCGGACKAMLLLDSGLDVSAVLPDFFGVESAWFDDTTFSPVETNSRSGILPAWVKSTTAFPRICNMFSHYVVLDGVVGRTIVFRDPYSCTARVITIKALKDAMEAMDKSNKWHLDEDSYPACLTGYHIA
jgi:hypothetical protein